MRLITIPISHYCEKARWALDLAGLPYREEPHVQGFHRLAARRAGGGRTVPILCTGNAVLSESHDILKFADEHMELSLFPTEEAARLEADYDQFGVETRRLMYRHFLAAPRLVYDYNSTGAPRWQRLALRVMFRMVRGPFSRYIDVSEGALRNAKSEIARTLDGVAERLADGRPYLLGDEFSAADLGFACMAAAIVGPDQYGAPLPRIEEVPAVTAELITSYRAHPAGAFALRMFEQRRR